MDTTDELKLGDVVRLNSDSPKMTVIGVSANGQYITCQWFSGDVLHQEILPITSLTLVVKRSTRPLVAKLA